MAILVFGAPLAGIRGTLGGVIYSANQSGPYARTWSRGSNVRSGRQTTVRTTLSSLAQTWRTLDPADQADWIAWAADPAQELTNALGQTYYLSGFLWFIRMSQWLAAVARNPIETAPVDPVPSAPTIATLRVSAGAVTSQITFAALEFGPFYDCIIELAIGYSTGAAALPLRPLLLSGTQVPGGTSLDISADIAARFGTVNLGQKAFALVSRQSLEGYRSAPTAIATDVIA